MSERSVIDNNRKISKMSERQMSGIHAGRAQREPVQHMINGHLDHCFDDKSSVHA